MDLNTLHERTGFSMRRLRYSVDLPLIPDCAVEVTTKRGDAQVLEVLSVAADRLEVRRRTAG